MGVDRLTVRDVKWLRRELNAPCGAGVAGVVHPTHQPGILAAAEYIAEQQPAGGGRLTGIVKVDGKDQTTPLTGGRALRLVADDKKNSLVVDWEYPLGDQRVTAQWCFGIRGKALTVQVQCATPVLAGLSLGHVANATLRRTIVVPYLPPVWGRGGIEYLPAHRVFVNRYLDWTASHASACPQGEATYDPKTDGTRNPLVESGYVAVSPHVGEVLPNIPHPPSPYLRLLGDRVMLDIWGHHQGTYLGDAENLRALKDLGVDHLAIIQHVWQRYGYDVKLPDHIPAPMRLAATTVHWLLYLGLIVQPVLGFVMTNAFGFPMQGATAYLGVIDIPALVAENQALAGTLKTLHTWVGYSIAALLAMHIAGAVYHHAIRRDGTLMRML